MNSFDPGKLADSSEQPTLGEDLRPSVRATYDSAEDGPQYTVTTFLGGRMLTQRSIPDPFISNTTTIGWRDLLRGLLHLRLVVRLQVSASKERIDDVLELDDQTLIAGRTRHAAFHQHINERFGSL